MTVRIAVLATLDTKAHEAEFLADRIRDFGGEPVVFDLGTRPSASGAAAAVTCTEIANAASAGTEGVSEKVALMERVVSGASAILHSHIAASRIDGVIAIGGGQGSWLASAILRPLPIGFPRLLVSTAGRDIGQYTQFSDLMSLFSITDVAGTNPLLRRILTNAAAAITGMARSSAWREPLPPGMVAVSVYGITTAGANVAMAALEAAGLVPVSFHANGVGGPTMESQIAAGTFAAVLDWSITETADEVVGGICTAGPDRLTNAIRKGLPQVVVPGGIDVVNFARRETVPARFEGRRFYMHTPEATLMRTDVEENRQIAQLVASRLNQATAPVRVIIPRGGFSALSGAGNPLDDPAADAAFEQQLTDSLSNPQVSVTSLPLHINDPAFAKAVAPTLIELLTQPAV